MKFFFHLHTNFFFKIVDFSLWGKQCIVSPIYTFFTVSAHCAAQEWKKNVSLKGMRVECQQTIFNAKIFLKNPASQNLEINAVVDWDTIRVKVSDPQSTGKKVYVFDRAINWFLRQRLKSTFFEKKFLAELSRTKGPGQ